MPAHTSEQELFFRLNDGSERRLRDWRAVQKFLAEVDEAWAWMAPLTRHADPTDMRSQVAARIQHLRNEAERLQRNGQPPRELEGAIVEAFNESQGPILPDSENGRAILDILEAAGPEAAITAFAFLRGHFGIGSVIRPAQFLGLMLLALPGAAAVIDDGKRLAKERENFRSAARRLEQEVQSSMEARAAEWEERLQQTNSTANGLGLRLGRRWLKRARSWQELNEKSVGSIKAVEASYREFMQLRAPVEYWDEKADAHRKSEHTLRLIVAAYFIFAAIGIVYMFREAAVFILNETLPSAALPGGRALPSGLFFVISAGLASAAGLLFWVGRLLTKLYLSEHHLRHDAEERAKMTQTYLALTAEGVASPEDRQIILTALFRNTPDGIVKEDGGFDPNIAAAIARMGMKP